MGLTLFWDISVHLGFWRLGGFLEGFEFFAWITGALFIWYLDSSICYLSKYLQKANIFSIGTITKERKNQNSHILKESKFTH